MGQGVRELQLESVEAHAGPPIPPLPPPPPSPQLSITHQHRYHAPAVPPTMAAPHPVPQASPRQRPAERPPHQSDSHLGPAGGAGGGGGKLGPLRLQEANRHGERRPPRAPQAQSPTHPRTGTHPRCLFQVCLRMGPSRFTLSVLKSLATGQASLQPHGVGKEGQSTVTNARPHGWGQAG